MTERNPELAASFEFARWLRDTTFRAVWFWTPSWQSGEREADADLAAGRSTYFETEEEFLAALRARTKPQWTSVEEMDAELDAVPLPSQ